MSASLPSLLADELDVSDEQARKLLIAMLREVKKRARREGVRLPEFGTFREADGQITFEPSPSLARAVNHRFEGLGSEDLATAPQSESKEEEDDEGPSTITLGYQDSDWTPLDAEEGEEPPETATDSDDDEPDTEEFEVPSAEEAADTDELQPPQATSPESEASDSSTGDPSSSSGESQTTETEELYPLVEDVPAGEETEETTERSTAEQQEAADEEYDSLSGIWGDDEDEDSASADGEEDFTPPEPDPLSESEPASEPDREPDPTTEPADVHPDAQPTQEVAIDPDAREPAEEPPSPAPDASEDGGGSTAARVGVGALVVLLLGGAAWYVLGRQGTVQPPRKAFAQLQAQIQPFVQDLSTATSTQSASSTAGPPAEASSDAAPDESGTDSSTPEQDPGADASTEAPGDAANPQTATTEEPSDPSEASSPDRSTTTTPQSPSSQAIDPSAGGWTIIVASRTQRGAAESLVQKYRRALAGQNVAVDIITGQVENQTRYRVGVGQFSSRGEAQRLLDEAGAKLPEGAWPLRLQ
jgi:hypothetical protein